MHRHPVYPFRLILREVRKEAGLTVLAAAEATSYGNYERWESGKTKVGAHHLGAIAEAFHIDDDLFLLLYAWLLDRFTPEVGAQPFQLTQRSLRKVQRELPQTKVDLGQYQRLIQAVCPHLDVALLCLVARYGTPLGRRRYDVTLEWTMRASSLPPAQGEAEPILQRLYGSVLCDVNRFVGRILVGAALTPCRDETDRRALNTVGRVLASPECMEDFLLAAQAVVPEPSCRGLGSFAALAARETPRFAGLARRQRKELRRLLQATTDAPVCEEDIDRTLAEVSAGQYEDLLNRLLQAARAGRDIPDVDPGFVSDLEVMWERLVANWNHSIQVEAADAAAAADPQTAFDLLDHLRAGRASEGQPAPN